MKKILLILIVLIIIAAIVLLAGAGLGFGLGKGFGTGNGDDSDKTSQNSNVEVVQTDETQEETVTFPTETIYHGELIKVTVSEKDYFFNNERITLDDLIATFKELNGSFIVEIVDDNATLRAYNKLIERLEDNRISYVEKPAIEYEK